MHNAISVSTLADACSTPPIFMNPRVDYVTTRLRKRKQRERMTEESDCDVDRHHHAVEEYSEIERLLQKKEINRRL